VSITSNSTNKSPLSGAPNGVVINGLYNQAV
jgi:hypothetical protein